MTYLVEYWIPVLALLVNLATLVALIFYTRITAKIERAAQKQAEATQMPVVVLKIELRQDSMDEAMERIGQGHIVQGAQLAVTANGHFLVRNIGTGPALNLTFDFLPVGSKDESGRHARKFPYVLADQALESPLSTSSITNDYRFTAEYESLSHKKYVTEMILHPRRGLTVVLRDNWIFKEVPKGNRDDT
jgi:hypothetical protein